MKEIIPHFPLRSSTGRDYISFSLIFGARQKGKLFFSNQKIRLAIEQNPWLKGNQIGFITYSIDHNKKLITSIHYYPFQTLKLLRVESLQKTGLASIAEFVILNELAKRFPNYSIKSTNMTRRKRKKQLRKQGRKPGKPIPIKKAVEIIRTYIRKKTQEQRGIIQEKKPKLLKRVWRKISK